MRCKSCRTPLTSMRVLDSFTVAFTCETCDRTLEEHEVVRPQPAPQLAAAR